LGLSLVYVVVCRLFELVVLLGRGERSKELEFLVLRHELSVVGRQADRSRFEPRDRLLGRRARPDPAAPLVAGVFGACGDAFAPASSADCEPLDLSASAPRADRRLPPKCANSFCGWHARTAAEGTCGTADGQSGTVAAI
jgi:hypothetical protein